MQDDSRFMQLPGWFSVGVECPHCTLKFIASVQQLIHSDGCQCPGCIKPVTSRDPMVRKRLEEGYEQVKDLLNTFMLAEINRFIASCLDI